MTSRDGMRRRIIIERVTALVILLIALGLVHTSVEYGLFMGGAPGPGLFPALTAGALALTSLVWLVTGGVVRDPVESVGTEAEGDTRRVGADEVAAMEEVSDLEEATDEETGLALDDTAIDRSGAMLILFCIVWAGVPILLIERLGFIFTVTLYVGGMLLVIAKLPWWKSLLGGLVGAIVVNWLAGLLGILLPRDPFGLARLLGL